MGLIDSIVGQVGDALSNTDNSNQGGLLEVVAGLINNPETGGLQGLINTFNEKGLGETIASWVGTGQNLPISGEQVQAALGSERVQAIAEKLGLSSADASGGLASLLPQLIDKLTPNGQLPEGGLLEQGLALLKGFGNQA
ncbi:YidB family protein [Methylococcus sp. EFPC2]|uniref:YidB family protein n=1 Tax=Methylococcus sp. EFPC2 TaxID=2812648 RepID=UPI0019680563|nr:YidB family protein [Methylococcus sp. EFPC2]QSA98328.1 DUF937 domain-containing protein [Methylococcus sp. EFPC2]